MRDFTHPFIHKSTLLSTVILLVLCRPVPYSYWRTWKEKGEERRRALRLKTFVSGEECSAANSDGRAETERESNLSGCPEKTLGSDVGQSVAQFLEK